MSTQQARDVIRVQIATAYANRISRAKAADKEGLAFWRDREAKLRAQLKRLGG